MPKFKFILISLIFTSLCSIYSQESNIVGSWLNQEGTSHIRIFKATDGKYYGKITWLRDNPKKLDFNNPDESKRSVPLLDLIILKGFTFDTNNKQWVDGSIYDPKNGKTYDCFMWFDENPDILFIKGFVLGMRFIGRETKWQKVKG
jgi:uncharacterized protein (DUF2147 family)